MRLVLCPIPYGTHEFLFFGRIGAAVLEIDRRGLVSMRTIPWQSTRAV
jgi:hypothetical protein